MKWTNIFCLLILSFTAVSKLDKNKRIFDLYITSNVIDFISLLSVFRMLWINKIANKNECLPCICICSHSFSEQTKKTRKKRWMTFPFFLCWKTFLFVWMRTIVRLSPLSWSPFTVRDSVNVDYEVAQQEVSWLFPLNAHLRMKYAPLVCCTVRWRKRFAVRVHIMLDWLCSIHTLALIQLLVVCLF